MVAIFNMILTLTPPRRFRWVYCQFETLRRCFPASIRRTLDELPETLDGTYKQTLLGIDKQKRDYACRLFQCLVVSKRPLRVEELAELFAIQPNAEAIPTFDPSFRPENPEEFILSACSTLVAVLNDNGRKIVQFSHFSVREYLTSNRIAISEHVSLFHVLPRQAHAFIARACLSILLQLDDRVDRDNIRNFPMASYAAQYLVDHARFEDVSAEIQHGLECLFDRNKPHFAAWLWLYNIDSSLSSLGIFVRPVQPLQHPLYYAALCGFRDIAEHLLDAYPQDVNARGGERGTPLNAAVDKRHLNVAILLLERGADIESRDRRSRTPLHIASYLGYDEVASLLINRGADLNAKGVERETPLHLALERDHDEIVQLLLDHGADANFPDNRGLTALHLAYWVSYDHIVRLLLDHGADANHADSDGLTLLHHASLERHSDITQLLLDSGADTNCSDSDGLTPLHFASRGGYDLAVQLLLDHGADPNHPDIDGLTPLHFASREGYDQVIQILLDHGADANRPDSDGWAPIHIASWEGRNDIVQLLLSHGVDANSPDNRGWTPLHLASQRGRSDIVQLLLDHGAVAIYPG